MKSQILSLLTFVLTFGYVTNAFPQNTFSVEEYLKFVKANKELPAQELLQRHDISNMYYSSREFPSQLNDFQFIDSVDKKIKLTTYEKSLLSKNHFLATERYSYEDIISAYTDIYEKDLPLMLTTDAILHFLHLSYDAILMDLEKYYLEKNLKIAIDSMVLKFKTLKTKYNTNTELSESLKDVDLYITVAQSLIYGVQKTSSLGIDNEVTRILEAIKSEELVNIQLFSTSYRSIDFSQFTVRGHYKETSLENYFRCMMWLGRIDFIVAEKFNPNILNQLPPEDLKRMCINAFILNELNESCISKQKFETNNSIIDYLVGESDNLKPSQFTSICQKLGISDASQLLNSPTFQLLQDTLLANSDFGQKILSSIIKFGGITTGEVKLPVSYLLMGQHFILDSYIFSKIVFPYTKLFMPNPLDAMFALGNNNALPLIKDNLVEYEYTSNLAEIRYLIDQYDENFWSNSLYNVWLNSIRKLHQPTNSEKYPYFMQTTAWQHEKLNTQLASWAQLRHDNILYAKPSYSGYAGCSFPHTYIEPYPEFYKNINQYAIDANEFFSGISLPTNFKSKIQEYFTGLSEVLSKLEILATKELQNIPFDDSEKEFLRKMMFNYYNSGCGIKYDGWIKKLYYSLDQPYNYTIADVHTQPTDASGYEVGNVLHVGHGNFNLGIFLAKSPSNEYVPMVYVGPVNSYYEKITKDFLRLDDQVWQESFRTEPRPDWVNTYLAGKTGQSMSKGRELPGIVYKVNENSITQIATNTDFQVFPNPSHSDTNIEFNLNQPQKIKIEMVNLYGQIIKTLIDTEMPSGFHSLKWQHENIPTGIYFCRIQQGNSQQIIKILIE